MVKYADNLLKTYATAIAIVLTCAVTATMAWTVPSLGFLNGMGMVIASVLLYNLGGDSKPAKPKPAAQEEAPPPAPA